MLCPKDKAPMDIIWFKPPNKPKEVNHTIYWGCPKCNGIWISKTSIVSK